MKGIEMEMVKFIILVVAASILFFIVIKTIPIFSTFLEKSIQNVKSSICKSLGWTGFLLGC